jgi:hypothetical protein
LLPGYLVKKQGNGLAWPIVDAVERLRGLVPIVLLEDVSQVIAASHRG